MHTHTLRHTYGPASLMAESESGAERKIHSERDICIYTRGEAQKQSAAWIVLLFWLSLSHSSPLIQPLPSFFSPCRRRMRQSISERERERECAKRDSGDKGGREGGRRVARQGRKAVERWSLIFCSLASASSSSASGRAYTWRLRSCSARERGEREREKDHPSSCPPGEFQRPRGKSPHPSRCLHRGCTLPRSRRRCFPSAEAQDRLSSSRARYREHRAAYFTRWIDSFQIAHTPLSNLVAAANDKLNGCVLSTPISPTHHF